MKISQREARRLRKRVSELESVLANQRRLYAQEWTGGTEIGTATFTEDIVTTAIRTARRLNHAVVVVGNETRTIRFIALPHPKAGL
jgi:hypothetical protein